MSDNVNVLIEKMNQEQRRKELASKAHTNYQMSDAGDVPGGRTKSPTQVRS